MKKTLITALVLVAAFVVVPAAMANEQPYPECGAGGFLDWQLGKGGVFAGRSYVASLFDNEATQAWKKDSIGTWVQIPLASRENPEDFSIETWATFTPVLGVQTITMGFTPRFYAESDQCMVTESIQVNGRRPFAKFRQKLDIVPDLAIWSYAKGYDCHSLPPGQFVWRIYVSSKLVKVLRYADACGSSDSSGPTNEGIHWIGKYIGVRTGTKAWAYGAPVAYIEVEPRESRKTAIRRIKIEATVGGHKVFSRKYTSYNRYYPGRTITENNFDDYVNICINENRPIYAKNGILYCTLSGFSLTEIKNRWRKGAK